MLEDDDHLAIFVDVGFLEPCMKDLTIFVSQTGACSTCRSASRILGIHPANENPSRHLVAEGLMIAVRLL